MWIVCVGVGCKGLGDHGGYPKKTLKESKKSCSLDSHSTKGEYNFHDFPPLISTAKKTALAPALAFKILNRS